MISIRRKLMANIGEPDPYKPVVITQSSTTGQELSNTLVASGIDRQTQIALRKSLVNVAVDFVVLSALKNTFARSRTTGLINIMSEYNGSYSAIINAGDQFYCVDPGDLAFANVHCSVVYTPSAIANGEQLKTAINSMLTELDSGRYIVYAVKSMSSWANQDFIIGSAYNGSLQFAMRWNGSSLQGYNLTSTWSFKVAAGDPIAFYKINDT